LLNPLRQAWDQPRAKPWQTFIAAKSLAGNYKMPKLPLLKPDDFIAIDIHAEEPCGYDDFQERMAEYFKSPNKHPPTS
jgi:hypothetical protein